VDELLDELAAFIAAGLTVVSTATTAPIAARTATTTATGTATTATATAASLALARRRVGGGSVRLLLDFVSHY
jgi:hypothetical protein